MPSFALHRRLTEHVCLYVRSTQSVLLDAVRNLSKGFRVLQSQAGVSCGLQRAAAHLLGWAA